MPPDQAEGSQEAAVISTADLLPLVCPLISGLAYRSPFRRLMTSLAYLAPGSAQLADGRRSDRLAPGSAQLADGRRSDRLAPGSAQLADGRRSDRLAPGSAQLADGRRSDRLIENESQ
jgi:hypothetical protein